jgi:probable F420-dependent oxidoreductase
MRVGVDIPYFSSIAEIREYVIGVEALGFDHIGFSEHVACTLDSPFPAPMFTFDEPWRESFTLAAFVAALTTRIEINPAMVLLPLYPPVLAAKQAAEVDNLSEGRLRIAASVGWNTRECESLGVDPATRAQRFEEQVVVLRRLWGERAVDHEGRFFSLRGTGISARPAAQIPIWFGAGQMDKGGFPAPKAIERAGRLADGFKFAAPTFLDLDRLAHSISDLKHAVAKAGRDPDRFGIEVRIIAQASTPAEWPGLIDTMSEAGATHLGFANRIAGGGAAAQLETLHQFIETTRDRW